MSVDEIAKGLSAAQKRCLLLFPSGIEVTYAELGETASVSGVSSLCAFTPALVTRDWRGGPTPRGHYWYRLTPLGVTVRDRLGGGL